VPDFNSLERLAGLRGLVKTRLLMSGWRPCLWFTSESIDVLMVSLSIVAVRSPNRQQPVLGFELNVEIVERALKSVERG
jgi:hypothetical protein